MLVIFFQSAHMVVECINTSSCQITCLSHSAAKYLAYSSCLANKISASQQKTSYRTAQTFTQTNGNAVKEPSIIFRPLRFFHQCIEKPGAIKMKNQLVLVADFTNFFDVFHFIATATATVRSIFKAYQI